MTSQKTVFLTGVTSFTGCFIARAFRDAGYKVTAALTSIRARYESDPLIKKRFQFSDPHEVIEDCPFGSGQMLEVLKRGKFGIFVNHGASIKGYRDPSFDYLSSVKTSLHHARELMEALRIAETKRFIHSGSIFEPDEGTSNAGMTPSSEAVSVYGMSKTLTWQALRFFAQESGVPMSKVIIPNPIGPYENPDRLFPLFVKMWKAHSVPTLKTPQLVRDHIPAQWLAKVYVDEAELSYDAVWSQSLVSPRIRRPSAFVLSNDSLVQRLVQSLKKIGFKGDCTLKLEPVESSEPLERFNSEPFRKSDNVLSPDEFWDSYAQYLLDL